MQGRWVLATPNHPSTNAAAGGNPLKMALLVCLSPSTLANSVWVNLHAPRERVRLFEPTTAQAQLHCRQCPRYIFAMRHCTLRQRNNTNINCFLILYLSMSAYAWMRVRFLYVRPCAYMILAGGGGSGAGGDGGWLGMGGGQTTKLAPGKLVISDAVFRGKHDEVLGRFKGDTTEIDADRNTPMHWVCVAIYPHTRTHAPTHAHTHANKYTQTHTDTHTHSHTHTHTRARTHTHTHTLTHIHTHTHTYACRPRSRVTMRF